MKRAATVDNSKGLPGKKEPPLKNDDPTTINIQIGGTKVLYGVFKHLVIRKSGRNFRMDRIDKCQDQNVKKKFKDNVTIEI